MQPRRIAPETGADIGGCHTRHHGAADAKSQRELAWRLECRGAARGIGEGHQRVDVEIGSVQIRVEPRRLLARRPGIGKAAFHPFAVDLSGEPVEGYLLTAE